MYYFVIVSEKGRLHLRIMTKKSLFLAILVLCLMAVTGCKSGHTNNKNDENKSINPAWEKNDKEPITLDWYVNFSWFGAQWGENLVSRKITEDTGIDINFIVPSGNESEKFNAYISSDTLPDIITLAWWEPQLDTMISKNMVYPLNELADQYDPYFWKVTDKAVCEWYTQKDGNLYCYPNSTFVPQDYEENKEISSNQTFLVRKDIYEAIGSPDMTTPEGFKNAVEKAAKQFPEINGNPIIPIGAHAFTDEGCVSFDQYLQNFLAIPSEKDGKFYDRYTDPEYIRWLKMFRELGAKGYLLSDIFIDQRIQMEEKLAEGRYFCMLYQSTDMADQQKLLYTKDPNSIYIAVDGPKNSKGDDPVLPGAGINGWTVTLISKNCKYPERAIALFSYLISDYGQKLTCLGIEGKTYDMVDGVPVIKKEVKELQNSDRVNYDRLYGANYTYWMFQDTSMYSRWIKQLEPPMKQLEEWTYPYTHYLGQYDISFDINTRAGNADINIKKAWSIALKKLLLAPTEKEFDQIYSDFVNTRKKMGFDFVMEESTRLMNEAKEKVGMK